jgi:hypothetical protein
MTREQLREGWMRAWQTFYSWSSIIKRRTPLLHSSWVQNLSYLPLNAMQRRLAVRKVVGGHQRFLTANENPDRVDGPAPE